MKLELREQPGERPYRVVKLDNGLRVVVAPQPQLHRAHVALYVRVGSRFETLETNGLSHFLEHMLYRGTPRLANAHEVNLAFESLGGYLYASTHADYGVFSVTLPPESLAAATALFADVLLQPTFADMDIEKQIVLEELLEDLDDEGRMIDADNLSRAMIYPAHPLGYTITGDEARIASFTKEMLAAHHRLHYTTSASVLAFSGAIDPDRALELAARHFAELPSGAPIVADAPLHSQDRPRIEVVENASSQTELRVCLRAVGESTEHRPVIDVLMRILDDGMSTRLYHRLCDDKGLCYDVSGQFDGYEDDGIIDFSAGVQHARSSVVAKEIFGLLEQLATTPIDGAELAKARRRNAWEVRAMFDSPEDLAGFYAGGVLFGRFQTPEGRLAENCAVAPERVRDFVRMVARPERLNVLAVGLLEDDEDERLSDVVRGYEGIR